MLRRRLLPMSFCKWRIEPYRGGRRGYLPFAASAGVVWPTVLLSVGDERGRFVVPHTVVCREVSLQTPVCGNVKKVDSHPLPAHGRCIVGVCHTQSLAAHPGAGVLPRTPDTPYEFL